MTDPKPIQILKASQKSVPEGNVPASAKHAMTPPANPKVNEGNLLYDASELDQNQHS